MTKPRPIVLAIITMTLALAGATAAAAAPHRSRSASPGPTVNLTAASKGCAEVLVALHGRKAPTITCLRRTRPPVTAGRAIYRTPSTLNCQDPAVNFQVITENGDICFTGSGYVGAGYTQIVGLSSEGKSWVRLYYNNVGSFFNVAAGVGVNEWFLGTLGSYGGAQNVGMTQLCDACGYHS